jgi:hypothetical protein
VLVGPVPQLESFQIPLLWGALLESLGSKPRRLMAHYLETTVKTLTFGGISHSGSWLHTITPLAQNHTYLLHGILGISAHHLHHLHSLHDTEYLALAQSQYITATSAFHLSTSSITQENSIPVLGFVLLTLKFHFRGSVKKEPVSVSNIAEVLEPFLALRSSITPAKSSFGYAYRVKLLATQRLRKRSPNDNLLQQLDNTEATLSKSPVSQGRREHCLQAVQLLRKSYHDFGTVPVSWINLAWWTSSVSVEYIRLIEKIDPIALLIFRCWCTFVGNATSK